MTWLDQLLLLGTGLVAIYLIIRFLQDSRRRNNPACNIYYLVSFIVLLVSGLLLIWKGYGILPNPEVIVVTTFIPLGISVGLVTEFYPGKSKGYLVFTLIGFIAIILTRYLNVARALQIITLVLFHSVAGLLIFFIPIFVVRAKKAPGGFIFVTVGGALIGLGGIALAFLKSGSQFLFFSGDLVMTILAPLLLLMTLAYTWGFVKKMIVPKKKK